MNCPGGFYQIELPLKGILGNGQTQTIKPACFRIQNTCVYGIAADFAAGMDATKSTDDRKGMRLFLNQRGRIDEAVMPDGRGKFIEILTGGDAKCVAMQINPLK